MKNLLMGLFLIFSLTGCLGEDYDFTPPTITLTHADSVESVDLVEANVDWRGENSKQLKRETEDLESFGEKQKPFTFKSGQKVDLSFDNEDFQVQELTATVRRDGTEKVLQLSKNRSFSLPQEKGEYLLVVDLVSDRGEAQYVGNIVIE